MWQARLMAATIGVVAWPPHVHVRLVEMLVEIDVRDDVWTDGRGRQIDGNLARLLEHRRVLQVRLGPGRLENDLDLVVFQDRVDARERRGDSQLVGQRKTFGVRLDSGHQHQVHVSGAADLVHQIGADVAGPDDGHLDLRIHVSAAPTKLSFSPRVDETNSNRFVRDQV